MKLATATGAAAAAEACKPEGVKLIPYLVPDQNVIPGVPAFFRSICAECDAGCGVVARVREGRAIKLEGNPSHPINAGALCARGQAALQGLYNPDRLRNPSKRADRGSLEQIAWSAAISTIADACKRAAQTGPDRVAFIGRPRGPSFDHVVRQFLKSFNSSRLHYYEPINDGADREAVRACFGIDARPEYRIDLAQTLISFGADFLETWHSPVELSRQYAQFRRPKPRSGGNTIGLAYYAGPRMSLTAAKSDYFISCRPGTEALLAWAIIHVMAAKGYLSQAQDLSSIQAFASKYSADKVAGQCGVRPELIIEIADAFHAPSALALAGTGDPDTHRAALILNWATGNVGKTQLFPENGAATLYSGGRSSLIPLSRALRAHDIDVIIVADSNPAFTLPPEIEFSTAIEKSRLAVWCGGVPDETAQGAHLLLPIHHTLEEWSDSTPRPGVMALGQPVMQPVCESQPLGDVLIRTLRAAEAASQWPDMRAAVEDYWSSLWKQNETAGTFDTFWANARRQGGIFTNTGYTQVQLNTSVFNTGLTSPVSEHELTFTAYPHIFLFDGRGADKPWLQENPEPIHQIVWDAWAEIHPDTAKQLKVGNNQIIRLTSRFGSINLPAKISEGIHPGAIAAPFGQGHGSYGRYARNLGANPWRLLPSDSFIVGVDAESARESRKLVTPLFMADMLDRPIVETIELSDFDAGKRPAPEEATPPEPYELWPKPNYPEHQWGMTIDLNSCTGCGACVTACYAENNLNVVGKRNVEMGRIMSWIRIERYFPNKADAPQIYTMPMLCQHCGHAPCEPVCPVYASYHTDEGLNAQIYNRCVGTRYCENNCPYKVRRFNWFKPEFAEPLDLQLNPDVTVRGAGVMEKCTFCVQRIRASEITAKIEERPVHDGEIIPACAQTCPPRAITFGDVKNTSSAMMRRRKENALRTYRALDEFNTQPSIVYLRSIYRKQRI